MRIHRLGLAKGRASIPLRAQGSAFVGGTKLRAPLSWWDGQACSPKMGQVGLGLLGQMLLKSGPTLVWVMPKATTMPRNSVLQKKNLKAGGGPIFYSLTVIKQGSIGFYWSK